ncbi:MAG: hypothetical protein U0X91_05450 [Spirosomataceae bacterium]
MNKPYQLFFVRNFGEFADGTLFELENRLVSHAQLSGAVNERRTEIADWEYDTKGFLLPDRGDGVKTLLPEENALVCPPFSENIPPGKGVIQITKTTTRSQQYPDAEAPANVRVGILNRNQVSIFQNIHFQRLLVELPSDRSEVEQITVNDKVKQWETECYYSPKIRKEEGKWLAECEFSHIPFGFYEVRVQFASGWFYRIDLIKHYPDYMKEKYRQALQPSVADRAPFRPSQGSGWENPAFRAFSEVFPAKFFEKATAPVSTDTGVNDEVLNEALALTTEWGANFRKPIAERLQRKYPDISTELAEKLQAYCGEAESYMYDLGMQEYDGHISEGAMVPLAQAKYPWVKVDHWLRLKNIAMYYARR